MRTLLMIAFLGVCGVHTAHGKDDEDLKLKVKVALALSAKQAGCGVCRTDEDGARVDALHDRKPLVLFVGGCNEAGEAVATAGGIPCRVDNYKRDGHPADEKRIVVLKPHDSDFTVEATLPFTATESDIRTAIGHAAPQPPKTMPSLDWDIQSEVKPAVVPAPAPVQVAPVKRYTQVCIGGVCYLVEVK